MRIILDGPDGDLISRAELIAKWNDMSAEERTNFIHEIEQAPTACRPDIMKVEVRESGGHSFSMPVADAFTIIEKLGIVIESKEKLDILLQEDCSRYASKRMYTELQG